MKVQQIRLFDFPQAIPFQAYENLKQKISEKLISHPGIKSIYQLGSVQHPGISDLDLLCVFDKDARITESLLPDLSAQEKAILTHSLLGIREKDLPAALKYNFYTNYLLLQGADSGLEKHNNSTLSTELKTQIALEFLLIFHISLTVQMHRGMVKLRAFLMEAKALAFDLELLGLEDSKLMSFINEVQEMRQQYFVSVPDEKKIKTLIGNFHEELELTLGKALQKHTFYLPYAQARLNKNTLFKQQIEFSISAKGIKLPAQLFFLGRKYFNLQNRWQHFEIGMPYSVPESGSELEKRFQLFSKIQADLKENFPHFIPLTAKLNVEAL